MLLTAGQVNKLRDELLGQGTVTLCVKSSDSEDGGLVSKNHLPQVRILAFLILKGRSVAGCCQRPGARILCTCSCPGRPGNVFLQTSSKTNVIFCSVTFYLCMNGKLLSET